MSSVSSPSIVAAPPAYALQLAFMTPEIGAVESGNVRKLRKTSTLKEKITRSRRTTRFSKVPFLNNFAIQ